MGAKEDPSADQLATAVRNRHARKDRCLGAEHTRLQCKCFAEERGVGKYGRSMLELCAVHRIMKKMPPETGLGAVWSEDVKRADSATRDFQPLLATVGVEAAFTMRRQDVYMSSIKALPTEVLEDPSRRTGPAAQAALVAQAEKTRCARNY